MSPAPLGVAVADTSVLLAAFNRKDDLHTQGTETLEVDASGAAAGGVGAAVRGNGCLAEPALDRLADSQVLHLYRAAGRGGQDSIGGGGGVEGQCCSAGQPRDGEPE